MSHKFKLGQRVRQARLGYAGGGEAVGAASEIVRLMPEDRDGEPCYRIKSPVGERAVREGEIVLAS